MKSLPLDGHASATLGRLALALWVTFAGALLLLHRLPVALQEAVERRQAVQATVRCLVILGFEPRP